MDNFIIVMGVLIVSWLSGYASGLARGAAIFRDGESPRWFEEGEIDRIDRFRRRHIDAAKGEKSAIGSERSRGPLGID